MGKKTDHHLDLKGIITPISLLKVTGVFRKMKKDETLEIVGCDQDTRTGLVKVLRPSSYELERAANGNKGSHHLIRLKKTRDL